MTDLLTRLLGRLPIGWLQLVHNKTRLLAALGGVAFANVLVFMQLGFLGALVGSIELPYDRMDADILISGADSKTLNEGSPVPRQRMFEALAVDGVASAAPLYIGKVNWRQPDGTSKTLDALGVDPSRSTLLLPDAPNGLDAIRIADHALIDEKIRNVDGTVFERIRDGERYRFETRDRTITFVGTFGIGGGFSSEGYMVVSDQTFLRLFPSRSAGAPDHILVRVRDGADAEAVRDRLRRALPNYDTLVRTLTEAMEADQAYQTTQKPVGLIFYFGVVIGVLVGIIIVYQVLSTDVADHLREYATFKAIGFPQRFFLSSVIEEAMVLALLGFVPGAILSVGLYAAVTRATGLPVAMDASRLALVLVGTIAMCIVSGAIATRRLARADPADLF